MTDSNPPASMQKAWKAVNFARYPTDGRPSLTEVLLAIEGKVASAGATDGHRAVRATWVADDDRHCYGRIAKIGKDLQWFPGPGKFPDLIPQFAQRKSYHGYLPRRALLDVLQDLIKVHAEIAKSERARLRPLVRTASKAAKAKNSTDNQQDRHLSLQAELGAWKAPLMVELTADPAPYPQPIIPLITPILSEGIRAWAESAGITCRQTEWMADLQWPLAMRFNASYLRDALKACSWGMPMIKFSWSGELEPLRIDGDGPQGISYNHLIMPIRRKS